MFLFNYLGLLFAYAFVNVKDELPYFAERFDYRKTKSQCSEILDVKHSTKSCPSALEKEFLRLKTKAFGLENMIRKMVILVF